jgi:hypothetical protein
MNVVPSFHGDDSGVIFLIDPDKEVSSLVVEDTTSIGPVTTTTGRKKEGGVRLLEKVSSLSEGLFLIVGHTSRLGSVRSRSSEREIVSLEFTF